MISILFAHLRRVLLFTMVMACAYPLVAQMPRTISYQGLLTQANGEPIVYDT